VCISVVGNVLGSVSDLATSEELLGVGGLVKDDSKGSGHVDGIAILVEEDVLSAVSASVSVDVLEVVLDIGG
jgi:hypothetical protein